MTDHTRTMQELKAAGVVAVLRGPDRQQTVRGVDALVAGGVRAIEITYTTPSAAAVIAEVRHRYGDEVILGAGTVLSTAQAEEAVGAGATFLVSPGSTPELARGMVATEAAVLLGALTPSEVMQARNDGATAVKLFPASLGGPAYLKALRGPFPDVPLLPTGGVHTGNVAEWLVAGAFAVGAGSELCSTADLAEGRWARISEQAEAFRAAVGAHAAV